MKIQLWSCSVKLVQSKDRNAIRTENWNCETRLLYSQNQNMSNPFWLFPTTFLGKTSSYLEFLNYYTRDIWYVQDKNFIFLIITIMVPMGVLAPGSARACLTLRSNPNLHRWKFSSPYVSEEGWGIFFNFHLNSYFSSVLKLLEEK